MGRENLIKKLGIKCCRCNEVAVLFRGCKPFCLFHNPVRDKKSRIFKNQGQKINMPKFDHIKPRKAQNKVLILSPLGNYKSFYSNCNPIKGKKNVVFKNRFKKTQYAQI